MEIMPVNEQGHTIDTTNGHPEDIQLAERQFKLLVSGAGSLVKPWKIAVLALVAAWLVTIGGFLYYLLQYDYTSSVEAVGVYTAVDKSGNIVAKDLTDEQFEMFMEWLDGNNQDN